MKKQKLIVSFSGGRTSAFMTHWILNNLSAEFEILIVFANTGKEREETLEFVNNCDKYLGFNTVWIEAVINTAYRKGPSAKEINFKTASRKGEPFQAMIAKYGIPNTTTPHCTRVLKVQTIQAYARQIGWQHYYTAIGIRVDEIDRMNSKRKELRLIYPLISSIPTTKNDVLSFWQSQKFDLELKAYEGNCDVCWKKSFRKLKTLAVENTSLFDWWQNMEKEYEMFTPSSRIHNTKIKPPHRFFRDKKSVADILSESKMPFNKAVDDSYESGTSPIDTDEGKNSCEESCEAFGEESNNY